MESISLNVKKFNSESDNDDDDDTPLQQRINTFFCQTDAVERIKDAKCKSQGPIDVAINTEEAQSHALEMILALASVQVKVERSGNSLMSSGSQDQIDVDIGTDELDHIPQSMDTVSQQHDTGDMEVKVETLENGLASPRRNEPGISLVDKILGIKSEMGVSWISNEDELDHMSLRERLRLLTAKKVSDSEDSRHSESLQKSVPPVQKCKPTASENAKPGVSSRQRKAKKDCKQTALEEDAPGLLKVLVEKGILLNEIKLYGGMESEDALDSSLDENSFEDLSGVISKVERTKAANYCLSCLISLVEKSRLLQSEKWPVEWGWCRDLQSFIFVFERHNRIVLERPEYGYVGEDLSEGEARVLEEYGWIPNSGLGSMLNYCDRKIGKLLRDGLNGGTIVFSNLPKKLMGDKGTTFSSQIKLEL
ncbi:hypothetical protein MKW92_031789 [Papaver armeniacum]|nr:hypothetical protein MKW92_031789 [Papaver armeniacum]